MKDSKETLPLDQPLPDVLLPGEEVMPSRRAFLQYAGYGVAASVVTGCSAGVDQAIVPYLTAPEDIVTGRGYWIATTCGGCSAACGVLAKCRDGRPIKLEGNPTHALSRGGLCAVGQAEVLALYDSKRPTQPTQNNSAIAWDSADREVIGKLEAASKAGGQIRVLTGTEHGPSTRAALAKFTAKYPGAKQVVYSSLSVSAILDAHEALHGKRVLPSFRFDKARVIVSFAADFLGTWISPVAFAADYAKGRKPDQTEGWMSRHIALESRLSLTGSAADERVRLAPHEFVPVLTALCQMLEKHAGGPQRLKSWKGDEHTTQIATKLAHELEGAKGQSLIVCGENSATAQQMTAYANELLHNYGKTLSVASPSLQRSESDGDLAQLRAELEAGKIDVLVVSGVNPAYDLPAGYDAALKLAKTLVVHSTTQDETAVLASMHLPRPHFLESWGDGEPEVGRFSLMQPTIPLLGESRTLREMLSRWTGETASDLELLRSTWRDQVHALVAPSENFDEFFARAQHDGYVEQSANKVAEPVADGTGIVSPAAHAAPSGLGLVLYPKIGLLDGRGAHNPWLQELPDPISKITWDNYACFSPTRAAELDLEDGDVVSLSLGDDSPAILLPALIQRGQHDDVVAIPLGYGRRGTDRFAEVGPSWFEGVPTVARGETIGVNAAPWIEQQDGSLSFSGRRVSVTKTSEHIDLASTQDHHSLDVPEHLSSPGGETRDAVRVASFGAYKEDPDHAFDHGHHPPEAEMWQLDHEPKGHHWGMSIDLSSCIGCSACSVSCQAENNVPVVGKDEVLRHREMHWMRIDRYLEGEGDEVTAHYQPMFCQQCDNAPCEGVCPVLATVHSTEGLNQQVYNRCVGTRYCANTCPYKVRRFNWFNYNHEDHLANQALNPDVTVRSRGVMEKCSFCAQRIQEAKSESARTGAPLMDGDIQVACQQSCPTQAIVFGDLNDPESRVSKQAERQRSYRVLEELNVKPSVRYLGRVRNREDKVSEGEHHG